MEKKINPHGRVKEVEKGVGASQMANGSEHGHKRLLDSFIENDETNAQWSKGNWLKVTQMGKGRP